MPILIKKRVSLDFLGEEYKEAYLLFKSIPVVKYEEIQSEVKKYEKNPAGSVKYILDLLKSNYIEGKFPIDGKLTDVSKEDLDDLDPSSITKCFQVFTGVDSDPKDETPSTSTSPTAEPNPQSNS